jgi:hypothetical protein
MKRAGYAGGIVSAAVDGLHVGEAIVRDLLGSSEAGQELRLWWLDWIGYQT